MIIIIIAIVFHTNHAENSILHKISIGGQEISKT